MYMCDYEIGMFKVTSFKFKCDKSSNISKIYMKKCIKNWIEKERIKCNQYTATHALQLLNKMFVPIRKI